MSTITSPTPSMSNRIDGISVVTEATSVSTRWPLYGFAAGVTGLIATYFTTQAVTDAAKSAGVEAVWNELHKGQAMTRIGASLGFLSVAFLVAFAVGLVRFVRSRVPESSSTPAAMNMVMAGAVGSMTIAFGFKAMLAGGMPGGVDRAFYTHTDVAVLELIVSQMQWLGWMGVAMAMVLTSVASFRHRAVPRWLGSIGALFGLFVTAMTLGIALPYSAGVVSAPWLIIAGLGLIRTVRKTNTPA